MNYSELRKLDEFLADIGAECRGNADLQAEMDADPQAFFQKRGYDVLGEAEAREAEVRVVANTPDVVHLVLPPDPNDAVADETLTSVAGGTNCVQAGSFSSLPSCFSSAAPL